MLDNAWAVSTPEERARDELLGRGLEDMLMLSEMGGVVGRHLGQSPDSPAVVRETVRLIADFVASGAGIVGDVVRGSEGLLGVESWGLSADETADRVASEWSALGRLTELGQVCWLELTETGRAEARERRG